MQCFPETVQVINVILLLLTDAVRENTPDEFMCDRSLPFYFLSIVLNKEKSIWLQKWCER